MARNFSRKSSPLTRSSRLASRSWVLSRTISKLPEFSSAAKRVSRAWSESVMAAASCTLPCSFSSPRSSRTSRDSWLTSPWRSCVVLGISPSPFRFALSAGALPQGRARRPAPGCSAAGRQASHGPASGGGRLHGEMQKGLLFLSFSIIHGQSRQFFKDFLKVWRENCGAALQKENPGFIMERDAQGYAMPANGTPAPKKQPPHPELNTGA